MSMNLNCNKVDLWQTPTRISHMCMIDDNGDLSYEYKGKKAKAALKRYIEWAHEETRSCSGTKEECEEHWKWVNGHIKEVENAINQKGLKVWVM